MKKLFALSLGGSLVNSGEVDTGLLKQFKILIESEIKKGNRFIIVVGGGKPARRYQDALRSVIKPTADQLDWMGIFATHFNAELVRLSFGKLAHEKVCINPTTQGNFKEKILIAAGWKPGWSTDFVAVTLAKNFKAEMVVNLSNIDHAYTKDPKKFTDAKKIESTTWKEFRKIVGSVWKPGANAPFDPIASKLAEKEKVKVIIANGKNLKNLQNILNRKQFIGTVIE